MKFLTASITLNKLVEHTATDVEPQHGFLQKLSAELIFLDQWPDDRLSLDGQPPFGL